MSLGLLAPEVPESDAGRRPEPVGPWRRGVARSVDLALLEVVVAVGTGAGLLVSAVAASLLGREPAVHAAVERLANRIGDAFVPRALSLEGLTNVLALIVMHTLGEGLHGSTPGKRLLGLTVRSVDGGPASLRAAWSRSAGFIVDQMVCGLVGFLRIRGSPLAQRFGDEWADTVVVRLRDLEPARRRSALRFAGATLAAALASAAIAFAVMLARVEHGASRAGSDSVKVVRAVMEDGAAAARRSVRVVVDYSLGSAERGTLRCVAAQDGEVRAEEIVPVALGARSKVVVLVVPLSPAGGPGYPDRPLEIVAALLPEENTDSPSATDSALLPLAP